MSETSDPRQYRPHVVRNRDAILEVLERVLPPRGLMLEIASGSGEHAAYFAKALPALTWQPSDPDQAALDSIAAHRADMGLSNLLAPMLLDVTAATWPVARADAILCCNMIHIAPWAACEGLLAGAARERVRTILLVSEVALAVILLVGAGLFVSSFVRLLNVDLGLDFSNVTTIGVYPRLDFGVPKEKLDADMARTGVMLQSVLERVHALPGVQYAALMGSGSTPLTTGWSRTTVTLPGKPPFDNPDDLPDIKAITPEYFALLRVPLLRGRTISVADSLTGAPQVVVLNDIAAKRFFQDQDPIGAPIKVNGDRTVIGIVRAVRIQGPEGELRPEVYVPLSWQRAYGGTAIVRSSRDPAALGTELRAAVRSAGA